MAVRFTSISSAKRNRSPACRFPRCASVRSARKIRRTPRSGKQPKMNAPPKFPMKPSKTDYRGGEALTLASPGLELTVTTAVGPRVVALRSKAGKAGNIFLEMPANEKRAHGFLFRGGHRLWHSPEDIVRTYQPDDEPLAVKTLPSGVALTQPVEKKTGIEKAMRLELVGERTVKVTHTLTNRGLWAVECAAWALTMFRPGGYGVLP